MRAQQGAPSWDRVALTSAFQITLLEGTEVLFIVVAMGAGGVGLLLLLTTQIFGRTGWLPEWRGPILFCGLALILAASAVQYAQ